MSNYDCPKCHTMRSVIDDSRAKSFYCEKIECGFSVKFDRVREIACSAYRRQYHSGEMLTPTTDFKMSRNSVNSILTLIQEADIILKEEYSEKSR